MPLKLQQIWDGYNDNSRVPDSPREEYDFPEIELLNEAMMHAESPKEPIVPDALKQQSCSSKGLADHIEVGSVYEIDREKLPPTTPKVLQESVRVVLVTVKSEKNIKIMYPTESLDPRFTPVPLPIMDRFEMDLELAVEVLGRRIPLAEHIRKATLQAFWLVKSLQTEKGSPSITEIDSKEDCELTNGTCFSKDLCVGRKQQGEENQTANCGEEFEENDADSVNDVEVEKLELKVISTDTRTEQRKRGRSDFPIDVQRIGDHQVSLDFDAVKAEKEMQQENHLRVKYIKKFEKDDDGSHGISNPPSNVEAPKLELQEFSADKHTEEGNPAGSIFSKDGRNISDQVSHDLDANKVEEKVRREQELSDYLDANKAGEKVLSEKEDELDVVSTRSRKKRKTCMQSETRNKAGKTKVDKTKAAAGKVNYHGWWSPERYEKARGALLDVMLAKNAVYGNAICRKDLRNEAIKRVGDTGLLDHLLKKEMNKVAPDGAHRFRRWHDPEGNMKFWLESADLFELRKELGIQDPYWTPPPGWKPGDSTTSIKESICAATINFLKDEIAREDRSRKMQNLVAGGEDDEWPGSIDLDAFRQNPITLKEMHGELLKRKAELEKELSEISKSMSKYEAVLIKPLGTV